jgi:hypothetical protein
MSIDYLPDEMDALASKLGYNGVHPQFADGLVAGWRAACEAWHARAQAKAAPDWRAACVVAKREYGWDAVSQSGQWWTDGTDWFRESSNGTARGFFAWEHQARAALAACPTPPPDWRQP